MDSNFIKDLIKEISSSSISDFELKMDTTHIKISKNSEHTQTISAPIHKNTSITTKSAIKENNSQPDERFHIIRSPIVGSFYSSPLPGSKAFVSCGDLISKGDVVCIIEAMKIMNEVASDFDGKVVKILAENGQIVEYNQPLFYIE
jgi:acetyl-CoA carboxylase biotin carboxyl carrier protein